MSLLSPVDEARGGQVPPRERLTIRVSAGVGEGRTRLSAFDAALVSAGVANFNLVRLSSVIPPGADVLSVGGPQLMAGVHGDRLYCVYAEAYASIPQEEAWAGVAWSRRNDDSGEGLFVEHGGVSEATVTHDLRMSLADLSHRRGSDFVEAGLVTTSTRCVDHPVCALVIATYYSAGWSDRDH
jgi:arginine decarboxylase